MNNVTKTIFIKTVVFICVVQSYYNFSSAKKKQFGNHNHNALLIIIHNNIELLPFFTPDPDYIIYKQLQQLLHYSF